MAKARCSPEGESRAMVMLERLKKSAGSGGWAATAIRSVATCSRHTSSTFTVVRRAGIRTSTGQGAGVGQGPQLSPYISSPASEPRSGAQNVHPAKFPLHPAVLRCNRTAGGPSQDVRRGGLRGNGPRVNALPTRSAAHLDAHGSRGRHTDTKRGAGHAGPIGDPACTGFHPVHRPVAPMTIRRPGIACRVRVFGRQARLQQVPPALRDIAWCGPK